MCLSFEGCEVRGLLGLLLGDGLLRGRFGEEERLVRLCLRRLLVKPVGRVVGRPFLGRLRCLGRRLRAVFVMVVVVATEFESVVVAVLLAAVIAMPLAQEALTRQQERSLAERAALVWTAVWVVHCAAVLGLQSAMRRWWSAREQLALPW
jgi:hypothetical protein